MVRKRVKATSGCNYGELISARTGRMVAQGDESLHYARMDATMKELSEGTQINSEGPQMGRSPDDEHTGAPADGSEREYGVWESFHIRIESELAKYLYSLGSGNLSEGVTIAGKFQRANAGGGD